LHVCKLRQFILNKDKIRQMLLTLMFFLLEKSIDDDNVFIKKIFIV